MPFPVFTGFFIFTVVSAFTPGPNNIIALSSGVGFGFKRTLPHVWGVAVGFAIMTFLVGLGVGLIFERWPWVQQALLVLATFYLVYLAWNLARSGSFHTGTVAEPLSFFQSVLIQWLNPKAWLAIITILSAFVPKDSFWISLSIVIAVDVVIAWLAVATWALFGVVIKRWLDRPKAVRIFNIVMAALLVLSLIPSFFH